MVDEEYINLFNRKKGETEGTIFFGEESLL